MARDSVLILDDNRDLADNLAEILAEVGLQPAVYDSPLGALDALVPGRFAVAVVDHRMPGMDGVEFCQRLQDRDPGVPALVISAFARDDMVREALRAGANGVLAKPLDYRRLLARAAALAFGPLVGVVMPQDPRAHGVVEALTEAGLAARAFLSGIQLQRASAGRRLAACIMSGTGLDHAGRLLLEQLGEQTPAPLRLVVEPLAPGETAHGAHTVDAGGLSSLAALLRSLGVVGTGAA